MFCCHALYHSLGSSVAFLLHSLVVLALCPGCLVCVLILQVAFYGACLMAAQTP